MKMLINAETRVTPMDRRHVEEHLLCSIEEAEDLALR